MKKPVTLRAKLWLMHYVALFCYHFIPSQYEVMRAYLEVHDPFKRLPEPVKTAKTVKQSDSYGNCIMNGIGFINIQTMHRSYGANSTINTRIVSNSNGVQINSSVASEPSETGSNTYTWTGACDYIKIEPKQNLTAQGACNFLKINLKTGDCKIRTVCDFYKFNSQRTKDLNMTQLKDLAKKFLKMGNPSDDSVLRLIETV